MSVGYNFILKGGWRWKLNSRGGYALSVGYSNCQSKIIRERSGFSYNYVVPDNNEPQKMSINRFDISLLDAFLVFGKNNEGYFHVAIDLVFNQNSFTYEGIDYSTTNHSKRTVTDKTKFEEGLGTQYGLHFPVSDHFGIAVDGALLMIQLKKKSTDYITYSTTSTTASGIYGYFNLGLVYGIW